MGRYLVPSAQEWVPHAHSSFISGVGETDSCDTNMLLSILTVELINKYKYRGNSKITKIKFSQLHVTVLPILLFILENALVLFSLTAP